jgi:sugar phosphate isomerase/epimerase
MKWLYALSTAVSAPDTAPILLRGDICKNLQTAADLGFNGIEIHIREDEALDYEKIADYSVKCGVRVAAVITGRLNTQGQVSLIDERPYITEAAMKGMEAYLSIASRLGADIIIGWIKGAIPPGGDRAAYLSRLARNLKTISLEARDRNVRLFLEVINRYETNVFTTAKETLDFLETRDLQNCFVHLDSFHMNIEETDPAGAIRACGKRLGYFHMADNTRLHPGSGTLDFEMILKTLAEVNFEGFLSVECLPVPDGKTAASRALQFLKQCEENIRNIHNGGT